MVRQRIDREKRSEWKVILRGVIKDSSMDSTISGVKAKIGPNNIAKAMNLYLKAEGYKPIDPGLFCQYVHLPIEEKKAAEYAEYRVPQSEIVANSIIWALEGMGAWDLISREKKEEQKDLLLSLLGYNEIKMPSYKVMVADEILSIQDFDYNQTKEFSQRLLFKSAFTELEKVYQSLVPSTKSQVIGDLELLLEKYSILTDSEE